MPLTLTDVRGRVETDLDDTTLQRILDAAIEDVERHAGPADSEVATYRSSGKRILSLLRRAGSVSSITERRSLDSDPVVLDSSDYRQLGYDLIRQTGGDNPASTWGAEVVVQYVPEVDSELRDRVALDLCQVDVEFRGLQTESAGDWSGDWSDYEDRRRYLLAQVQEGRSLVV